MLRIEIPPIVLINAESDDTTLCLRRRCPFCNTSVTIKFDRVKLTPIPGATLIQDIYPNLTASQREFIKTGICDDCWQSLQKSTTSS